MKKNGMKQQRYCKWMIIFLLVVGFTIPSSLAGAEEPIVASYSDVDKTSSHYYNIIAANHMQFMTGFPDGSFKPNMKLTRGNVVKALGKYILATNGKGLFDYDLDEITPFNDIPATYPDQELYYLSLVVKYEGVFDGHENNLMPKNLISRQQMSKVLVNTFNLTYLPGVSSKVTDNHLAQAEYRPYIDLLSINEVTTVSKFRPTEGTTRAQFATFLISSYYATN